VKLRVRPSRPAVLLLALSLAGAGALYAQLEGTERGVTPIDSSSTYEVDDIKVDVFAKTAADARNAGWREAQQKGWKALWAKTHGKPESEAPNLPDSQLDSIVSAIEVDQEEMSANRYIATLGVLFDRGRTGPLLGGTLGEVRRSAPMLVIPVMLTASSSASFEYRTEWQKAWARFRTGNSPIDYVRPIGNGIDPLLLNGTQTNRPGRHWWRMLLDQYGASDIVTPVVQLRRSYPGGPVIATFWARHGPDSRLMGSVTLQVERSELVPKLLDEGVKRIDAIYTGALQSGQLSRDSSLTAEETDISTALAEQIEQLTSQTEEAQPTTAAPVAAPAQTFTIRVDTPSSASVAQAESSVNRIPGVSSALTTSLALGGTSLMRVTYAGDMAGLQAALQAQGWAVQPSGGTIRISRSGQ
jgi:hypothetical protein